MNLFNDDEDFWQQMTDLVRVGLVLLGIGAACIAGFVWLITDLYRVDVKIVNDQVDKQATTCGSCRKGENK